MIRLLIFALLAFLAYTLYNAIVRSLPGRGRGNPPQQKTDRGEAMVKDPQCGTFVPRGEALEKVVNGRNYYFCSKECRDAFSGNG